MDISPLLHYLWQSKKISEANFLGIVQFGTETFHSSENVTFSTNNFNLSLASGKPLVESGSAAAPQSHLTMILILGMVISFACSL